MTKAITTNKPKCQPFVKWAGGKRGLLSQLLPLFPKEFKNYFEPFVGGGAVFFELYSQGLLDDKEVYLSDINSELINTYEAIKNKPQELIKLLKEYKKNNSSDFFYELRTLDRNDDFSKLDDVLRAGRFIYLNKTCFNGLYRVNKKNQNNVPYGKYKNPNICDAENIFLVSDALKNVKIKNSSFENVLEHAKKGYFIYFDPPYHPLTQTASFTAYSESGFFENEQIKLYETFKKLSLMDCKIALSNSDTEFIKNLYKEFNVQKIKANRFINSNGKNRGKIDEIVVRNYE